MDAIKELSSVSEDNFIQLLRNILDEYFHRHSSFKTTINADSQIRLQLEQLLRSTNPSSDKINTNDLPEHLQKIYLNFVNDYRHDIERYHVHQASQYMEEYRLKNFDWNIRIALHDEHLFKCRLPLVNLELELTNEKNSKDILLELDEQELNKLIDEMVKIDQTMNNNDVLLSQ
ncbi:unnamed protein product [Rotaria socialis]|uniref:COMM domain-containing protein n=1 Tax=Rotaria socialis TaxID=392032 RepID=A0A820JWG2_9BILA|nr:unnamed protein product [Rotaria socialis]CAF3331424.1 unnamed protein product [Rotaria socialis]CAF3354182.1 unnamed protein product [Rotaria socialis]CAF3596365.1 unnamed protein product [Rotaria socialis]CAF3759117.1 unnamed protein product [Rotaria socialis]